MSSIFTFNPSPPKPASPWSTPAASTTPVPTTPDLPDNAYESDLPSHLRGSINSGRVRNSIFAAQQGAVQGPGVLTDSGETVTTLAEEPQMGSVEYKLSLVGGKSEARLEQLTTQLLWRLQQSTSFHGTSLTRKNREAMLQESRGALYEIGISDGGHIVGLNTRELDESLEVLKKMAANIGAEVVVLRRTMVRTVEDADIALSLHRLGDRLRVKEKHRSERQPKKRAANRDSSSSEIQPIKESNTSSKPQERSDVVVAEHKEDIVTSAGSILKQPDGNFKLVLTSGESFFLRSQDIDKFHIPLMGEQLFCLEAMVKSSSIHHHPVEQEGFDDEGAKQLRVALTGASASGKSSLLGTVTSGEKDNGRGVARLALFKHRHEMVTGVTSSITAEVVGYQKATDDEDGKIITMGSGNVSSWTDVHAMAERGRIVYLQDSAGQLKYRRTMIRSLFGWSPHYVALLIPCDEQVDKKPALSKASKAHMDLCLKLGVRLIIVMTKMDSCSLSGIRPLMADAVSAVKQAGRSIISVSPDFQKFPDHLFKALDQVRENPDKAVPLLFTSAVNGQGIDILHKLLMRLPIPTPPSIPAPLVPPPRTSLTAVSQGITDLSINAASEEGVVEVHKEEDHVEDNGDPELTTLFHLEEIYGMRPSNQDNAGGCVVGGHVRYGNITIGDQFLIGPFARRDHRNRSRSATPTRPASSPRLSHTSPRLPQSVDEGESGDEMRGRMAADDYDDGTPGKEWKVVEVVSIQQLRLPVNTLYAGEAGTIGLVPVPDTPDPCTPPEDGLTPKVTLAVPIPGAPQSPPDTGSGTPDNAADKKAVTFASAPTREPKELQLHRGQVIVNLDRSTPSEKWIKGYTGLITEFDDKDVASLLYVGTDVTVYVGSVRMHGNILSITPPRHRPRVRTKYPGLPGVDFFGFDREEGEDSEEDDLGKGALVRKYCVKLHGMEWMERGAQVVIMKSGGAADVAQTEVFVGKVVERLREVSGC